MEVFLKVVTVLAQVFPIANGTLGGVSGQESVWRSVLSLMDHTLEMAYLIGLSNMIFEPSPRLGRLHQWDLFHTHLSESVSSIEIGYRRDWLAMASQQRRRATIYEIIPSTADQAEAEAAGSSSVSRLICTLLYLLQSMIMPRAECNTGHISPEIYTEPIPFHYSVHDDQSTELVCTRACYEKVTAQDYGSHCCSLCNLPGKPHHHQHSPYNSSTMFYA